MDENRRTLLNELTDGRVWLNGDLRIIDLNSKAVELFGSSSRGYRDRSFLELLGRGHTAVERTLRSVLEDSSESLTSLYAVLQTEKNGRVPVELTVYPLESGDCIEIGIVSREEVESNRQSLSAVYELSRGFIQTRERSELAQIALTAIIRGTDFIAGGIYLYEAENARLRLVSTEGRQAESEQLAEVVTPGENQIWTTFEAGKTGSNSLRQDVEMLSSDQRRFVTPIDSWGVLVAFVDEDEHLTLDDFEHTDGILSSLYAAIERARTEEELEEQREQAQEQSSQLRKLSRLNGIIRDVNRAMVNANDVGDLHQEIPKKLSGTPPYKAAWYGSYNPGMDEVVPKTYAGATDDLPEPISLTSDGEGDLIARAIQTHEPVCSHGIGDRTEWDHVRPFLVQSGLDTEIVIPVAYQGYTFGVFVIYAEPTSVGDREREVLSELGSVTGYAIASESSRSLSQTNEQVRLKLLVKDESHPLISAVGELETEIDIEYLEMESDCRADLFIRISGSNRPESLERLKCNEQVFEVTPLTERGDEEVHRVQVTDELFRAASALHLKIADAHVDKRGLVLCVDIAPEVSPRSVVDPMSRHADELQVLAKETAPKSGGSIGRLSALISQIMTDRQYEVLECAYDAGFFDWPREQTAEEVANRLGISQPTFSQHLRTAQRHILEEIFETDGSRYE